MSKGSYLWPLAFNEHLMHVSLKELNNTSAAIVRRAQRGEHVIVTDRGVPVAEIVPHQQRFGVSRELMRQVFARASVGSNPDEVRAELDQIVDSYLRADVHD